MSRHLYALVVVAAASASSALIGPSSAQSAGSYDPSRSCRFYVTQRLPVPVHCMAELLGNWVPRPYIDGPFMFRNREEWLLWRDRDDYRHWKNHEYSWGGTNAPQPVAAPSAPPPPPPSGQAAAVLSCPLTLAVRVAANQRPAGWTSADADAILPLQPPARAEGGTLYCSYTIGRERLTLTRPAWGHCVARADATGFDCTP